MNMETMDEYPKPSIGGSLVGQRYIKVKAKIKTWTVVEAIIDFDTQTNQFVIPSGYQAGAHVIEWSYLTSSDNGTANN